MDIGVAAGYAILCISLISLLSPYPAEGARIQAEADARASSAIASYVEYVGLQFLSTASSSAICSSLSSAGNASVIFGAIVDGASCGATPPSVVGFASLDLQFTGKQVEIESWIAGP